MKTRSFYSKLEVAQQERGSDLALWLSPKVSKMPLPIARFDDPFLPFGKAIIEATRDFLCGYVFDLASYLALGAAGAVALERTLAYAGADGKTITILHAPFASSAYVEAMSDRAFNVDGVTITRASFANAYTAEQGMGAFIVTDQPMGVPANVGLFLEHDSRMIFQGEGQQSLRIRLLGESVLYADNGEDFAAQVRASVSAQKNQS